MFETLGKRYYELSFTELEKKRKVQTYLTWTYFILSYVFLVVAVYFLYNLAVGAIASVDKVVSTWMVLIFLVAIGVLIFFVFESLKCYIFYLDLDRDKKYTDLMIYLKKKLGD